MHWTSWLPFITPGSANVMLHYCRCNTKANADSPSAICRTSVSHFLKNSCLAIFHTLPGGSNMAIFSISFSPIIWLPMAIAQPTARSALPSGWSVVIASRTSVSHSLKHSWLPISRTIPGGSSVATPRGRDCESDERLRPRGCCVHTLFEKNAHLSWGVHNVATCLLLHHIKLVQHLNKRLTIIAGNKLRQSVL